MNIETSHPTLGNHLQLEGIGRTFGSIDALADISLTVSHREIVCLAGHSGCGKSTLLRVIAGIEMPDRGRVILSGREVSGANRHIEPEERNIGFMFQDYALFPHLSVIDNVLFGLKRLDRAQARLRAEAIIERLGLERLSRRFPHMLSGGEQQRVALARALAPQPQMLLMDEPFSNLDRGLRDGVRTETIALLRELGTTAIMVTHDPEEALSAGDRIVLMQAGKIVQAGTAFDLYNRPSSTYAAGFFGAFNRIEATCRNGLAETPLGRFHAPEFSDGAMATVYIRPHCLRLDCDSDGIDGTVIGCTLMGEIEETLLSVAALPAPLRIRSTEHRRLPAGSTARISVASGQVLVF